MDTRMKFLCFSFTQTMWKTIDYCLIYSEIVHACAKIHSFAYFHRMNNDIEGYLHKCFWLLALILNLEHKKATRKRVRERFITIKKCSWNAIAVRYKYKHLNRHSTIGQDQSWCQFCEMNMWIARWLFAQTMKCGWQKQPTRKYR